MPRDVGDNHVEDWVRQLDTGRMTYAKSHRDRLDPEFAQLRETLDQSSRRLKAVLDERRWQPLLAGALQDSMSRVRDFQRLLQDELSQTRTQTAVIASPTILRRIVIAAETALKTLESHLAMADHFTKYAGDLHVEFTRLLHRRSLDPARLQNVARRILLEVRHDLSFESMMFLSDERLDPGLPSDVDSQTRTVVAASIRSAWWTAWTVERMALWLDRRELLTIAALLKDVGWLVPDAHEVDRITKSPPEKTIVIDRHHPSLSAGLAAGLHELSSLLPIWIAEHHERLDGTGFPRGLRGRQLCGPSRLLAIVSRFLELVRNAQGTVGSDASKADGKATVLAALQAEAECGELDSRLTNSFVNVLESELANAARLTPTMRFAALGRTWRAESSHSVNPKRAGRVVPEPKFSQSRAAGGQSDSASSVDQV
jgi:HD-GYP domain-containing protein (c-di-GMP phosphodiesterase class II)